MYLSTKFQSIQEEEIQIMGANLSKKYEWQKFWKNRL